MGPCFYIANQNHQFFFFYHRRIGLGSSDLELRLIITGDNDVVDLIEG